MSWGKTKRENTAEVNNEQKKSRSYERSEIGKRGQVFGVVLHSREYH